MSRFQRQISWPALMIFVSTAVLGQAFHYLPVFGFHAHQPCGIHAHCYLGEHSHHHGAHGHHHGAHAHSHHPSAHSAAEKRSKHALQDLHTDDDCLICQLYTQGKLPTSSTQTSIHLAVVPVSLVGVPLPSSQRFFTPYAPRGPPKSTVIS